MVWVPGNSEDEGNERADELSQQLSKTLLMRTEPAYFISYGTVAGIICSKIDA